MMSQITIFLAMDGYAAFVWPAYAVSLVALLVLGLESYLKVRVFEKRVRNREREMTNQPRES